MSDKTEVKDGERVATIDPTDPYVCYIAMYRKEDGWWGASVAFRTIEKAEEYTATYHPGEHCEIHRLTCGRPDGGAG